MFTLPPSIRVLPAIVLSCGVLASEPASAQTSSPPSDTGPLPEAIERIYPALVRIYVVAQEPSGGRMRKMRGAGSGAIISRDGYVVTNHHVAGKAMHLVCNLSTQEEVTADLIGTDPLSDVAVLKIRREELADPDRPLPVAEWGDSDRVRVGDEVFAMGSPGAISQSVTKGIVSNTRMVMPSGIGSSMRLDGEEVGTIVRWIMHDATIFGGNSGGPLVSADGRIIGVNEIGVANLGGAIPGNLARRIADELIKYGRVQRSWTGLALQPRLRGDETGHGALVASVVADSPADRAGIEPGDRLVSFDGAPTDAGIPEHLPLVNQRMLETAIGAEVEVVVERGGETIRTRMTTEAWEPAMPPPHELPAWGMVIGDISREMLVAGELESRAGARIASVRPGRPAAEARPALQAGDVIVMFDGEPVESAAELARLAGDAGTGDDEEVLVEVRRDGAALLAVMERRDGQRSMRANPARRAWLAVETQVLTPPLGRALGLDDVRGVRVTKLLPTTSGDEIPLVVGDVITHIEGRSVRASRPTDDRVFSTMLRKHAPGDVVTLTVRRDGATREIEVTLYEPPATPESLPSFEHAGLEFAARDLTVAERAHADEGGAVAISRVERGGWADLAGLAEGDLLCTVDGAPIGDVTVLEATLDALEAAGADRIVLFVQRRGRGRFLELEPVW